MLKTNDNQPTESKADSASSSSDDGMALILQQAGKSAAEVAALATWTMPIQRPKTSFPGKHRRSRRCSAPAKHVSSLQATSRPTRPLLR